MTLDDLFYNLTYKGKRKYLIYKPNYVNKEEFINIVNNCVNLLNIENKALYDNLYESYKALFLSLDKNIKIIIRISTLGIYSKTTTNIKYYLDRGWSIEESKEMLKNRQTTSSKECYINKFGEIEGITKFNERMRRQLNTWNNTIENKNICIYTPSQINFWLEKINPITNKKYSLEEAKQCVIYNNSHASNCRHKYLKDKNVKLITNCNLQYYLNKGYSEETSKELLHKRQNTVSLSSYINRNGLEYGLILYNKRIIKVKNTWNNKSDEEKYNHILKTTQNFHKVSKKSLEFFNRLLNDIYKTFNISFHKIYMNDNEYFIYDKDLKKIYYYDLCIKDINLIIEYNGILFHPNKNLLSNNDWSNWQQFISRKSAEEVYQHDIRKEFIAKQKGFDYITLWENEIDKDYSTIFKNVSNKILKLINYAN